jgi:hypothetical protein
MINDDLQQVDLKYFQLKRSEELINNNQEGPKMQHLEKQQNEIDILLNINQKEYQQKFKEDWRMQQLKKKQDKIDEPQINLLEFKQKTKRGFKKMILINTKKDLVNYHLFEKQQNGNHIQDGQKRQNAEEVINYIQHGTINNHSETETEYDTDNTRPRKQLKFVNGSTEKLSFR